MPYRVREERQMHATLTSVYSVSPPIVPVNLTKRNQGIPQNLQRHCDDVAVTTSLTFTANESSAFFVL